MGTLRRKFGMVFQYAALFDSMNVVENIAFPLIERYKLSRDEIMERVRDLLGRLDLANVAGIEQKFPPELSGGQRKRVGLARALIDRPEILLYDEPTTGLDPVATKNVDDMIRRTADEFGVTSVVISHDMASTFRIGDRISMLARGMIVVSGTPEEVLASTGQVPELREFVETSGLVHPRGPDVRRSWASVTVGALVLVVFGSELLPGPLGQGGRHEHQGRLRLCPVPRRVGPVREVARADRRHLRRRDRAARAGSGHRAGQGHHPHRSKRDALRERGGLQEVGLAAGRVLPGDRSRDALTPR